MCGAIVDHQGQRQFGRGVRINALQELEKLALSVTCLALTLLVHAEDQGLLLRVQAEATTSRTFSMKNESVESWHTSARSRCRLNAFQIRWIATCVNPQRFAIVRVLQGVA